MCCSFLSMILYAQNDLEKYIPFPETSEVTHPDVEIRTIVHIIKKSETEADNLTEDSLDYIHQQFDWINAYYRDLRKPTLPTSDGEVHYISSARITFKLEKILFHVDENDWDRMFVAPDEKHPMNYLDFDENSTELTVEGKWKASLFRAEDSLKVLFEDGTTKNLNYGSAFQRNGNTSQYRGRRTRADCPYLLGRPP